LETVKAAAELYPTRSLLHKFAAGAYKAAARNGWLDLVFTVEFDRSHGFTEKKHGLRQIRGQKAWTLETVRRAAESYPSRSELQRGAGGAYAAALKHGWLDSIYGPDKRYKIESGDLPTWW